IKHVSPKMWEGDKIVNTNIPGKLMEEAGLKKEQYSLPVKESLTQKKRSPSQKKEKSSKRSLRAGI
ncbi:MAG TPA: hypothetical protein VIR29_14965, partial [Anseongella sp.]